MSGPDRSRLRMPDRRRFALVPGMICWVGHPHEARFEAEFVSLEFVRDRGMFAVMRNTPDKRTHTEYWVRVHQVYPKDDQSKMWFATRTDAAVAAPAGDETVDW